MKKEKEPENKTHTVFGVVIFIGIVLLCIWIYPHCNKPKNIAETPTPEEIIEIHNHTVYEKSLSTGLCHEVVKVLGEDGKFVLRPQYIDCDKLKNVKVIETP